MSLRAKLEAVIYAAEEPVTLAQLAVLFGPELATEVAAEGPPPSEVAEIAPVIGLTADDIIAQELNPQERVAEHDVAAGTGDSEQIQEDPAKGDHPSQLNASPGQLAPASDSSSQVPEANLAAGPEVSSGIDSLANPDPARAARQRDRALRDHLRGILEDLITEYASGDRGMEIREVAGGYRMSTKPEYHDAVRGFVKSLKPPMKLSLQALETLAVVAYKQPVTAPEISDIRGVESAGTLGSLIARKLITTAGRKQVIGRPILYKTTKEFLLRFGLRDLNELPSMEEFEKMAGDLTDDLIPADPSGASDDSVAESGPRHNLAALAFPDENGSGPTSPAGQPEASPSERPEEIETEP